MKTLAAPFGCPFRISQPGGNGTKNTVIAPGRSADRYSSFLSPFSPRPGAPDRRPERHNAPCTGRCPCWFSFIPRSAAPDTGPSPACRPQPNPYRHEPVRNGQTSIGFDGSDPSRRRRTDAARSRIWCGRARCRCCAIPREARQVREHVQPNEPGRLHMDVYPPKSAENPCDNPRPIPTEKRRPGPLRAETRWTLHGKIRSIKSSRPARFRPRQSPESSGKNGPEQPSQRGSRALTPAAGGTHGRQDRAGRALGG
jgi:hypothetical protein